MSRGTSIRLPAALCLILSLASCDRDVVYHAYQQPIGTEWRSDDTLTFHTDTVGESAVYGFELDLRATAAVPYKELWIAVRRTFTSPEITRCDTVECPLTDASERFTGGGVHVFQYIVALPSMRLRKGQTGEVEIVHLMQRESLPGIQDVGIRITR